jgi:hypothetical protein
MELLSVAVEEGGFCAAPDLKGSPVPDDVVRDNIKKSFDIKAPVFKKKPKREGSYIFVAGGPSTLEFLDELNERNKKGEFIITSNKTYDFLIKNDIIPDACLVLDPKEIVRTYITKPNTKTTFYIATVCNPDVANQLIEAGCSVEKLLVGYGLEDESDVTLQRTLYPEYHDFLCGGTMAGLRAMNLAPMLGFSTVEYYGFDSCFSTKTPELITIDDPRFEEVKARNMGISYIDSDSKKEYTIDEPDGGFFYSYKKKRSESIQVAMTPDGKRFYTSPCFAHQAKQAVKWIDRLEDKLKVIIHGESLTKALLDCHWERKKKLLAGIGDKRWTDEYMTLQKSLHSTGKYGTQGKYDTELVGRAILALAYQLDRKISLLDYGCGDGSLVNNLKYLFNCIDVTMYDPFQEEYSKDPEGKFDVVTCFDVMEHVEEQCVENTLKYIASKTNYMATFSIALSDATKTLEDGRNAHITQHHPEWWINRLSKYFIVAEVAAKAGDQIIIICQALDAEETLRQEKEVACLAA